ncbi:MAG: SufE family protein [Bacteroidetes bacterium]|nr:MAG: SufE family protein [Bacteroidota bacterium]
MSVNDVQQEIVEEFEMFDDWMEKYEHIIEQGKELQGLEDHLKTDENLVKGCQSRVWLVSEQLPDGKIQFKADSDAVIAKGIIAMLIRVLNNRTPQEILDADLWFVDKIGLKQHLSPNRANGLVSMIKKIKMYALSHKMK